jgi:hypothetical protein
VGEQLRLVFQLLVGLLQLLGEGLRTVAACARQGELQSCSELREILARLVVPICFITISSSRF